MQFQTLITIILVVIVFVLIQRDVTNGSSQPYKILYYNTTIIVWLSSSFAASQSLIFLTRLWHFAFRHIPEPLTPPGCIALLPQALLPYTQHLGSCDR